MPTKDCGKTMTQDLSRTDVGLGAASYSRGDTVFEPLPPNDKRLIRRREVERFRGVPHRPRWNASVKDEAHPFPDRAPMYTLQRPFDDDWLERMPGASPLRNSSSLKPRCLLKWHPERVKVASHASTAARSCTPLSNRSFMDRIFCDCSDDKEASKSGWVPTSLTGTLPRHTFRGKPVDSSTKLFGFKSIDRQVYLSPIRRVKLMNESMRSAKERQRLPPRETVSAITLDNIKAPKAFKMSNIDDWWPLDPTLSLRIKGSNDACRAGDSSEKMSQ
uniref:Uncharacterized protein n=1 Tax=Trypanosoma congolense (strain IL3000) TaxID=1068625 RepID=G0UL00_TRYCI|nr:conserved hypothetical protein [Trypanosoma congolense IL3000]